MTAGGLAWFEAGIREFDNFEAFQHNCRMIFVIKSFLVVYLSLLFYMYIT